MEADEKGGDNFLPKGYGKADPETDDAVVVGTKVDVEGGNGEEYIEGAGTTGGFDSHTHVDCSKSENDGRSVVSCEVEVDGSSRIVEASGDPDVVEDLIESGEIFRL